MIPPHAITIGSFDAVHVGHRALIEHARNAVGTAGRVTGLVFDPHPATVLRPGAAPDRLTTFEQRRELLLGAGCTEVVRLIPSVDLLSHTPEQFADWLVRLHRPSLIVEGPDFRFGKGRAGDIDALERLGRTRGFKVEVVRPVEVVLTDHSLVTASSTLTRWLVAHGRVRDAASVLGRPYEMAAVVRRGDRRGRTIGFPTINLRTDNLLPGDGIYAGECTLPDGRVFAAGVHVGPRDTFGDAARVVEAHLIDPPRDADRIDGLEEYEWPVRLRLIAWLRDPARFESVQHLIDQMHRDCQRAADIVARLPEEART